MQEGAACRVALTIMIFSMVSASICHVGGARPGADKPAAASAEAEQSAAPPPEAQYAAPPDEQYAVPPAAAEQVADPPQAEQPAAPQADQPAEPPTAPTGERSAVVPPRERTAAPIIKALPDFLPIKLPPFPWWALPIPSKALPWSDPEAGVPHFPILDNLFLLLKIAESCFNCTYFLSVDTPLLLSANGRPLDLSPANLRLLYYQVVPFRLPYSGLSPLPLAFRIPSFLNGSYLLVTRSSSSFPRDNFVSLNYQRLLAPDLFISDSMVVHGISGFLAPFTLAIPFPSTTQ